MYKFDNYVFFTICEYTLNLPKSSFYSGYCSFCNAMKNTIILENFSKKDTEFIFAVSGHLMLLYGFNITEAMHYIGRYFNEEKYLTFERPTREIKEFFSSGFN